MSATSWHLCGAIPEPEGPARASPPSFSRMRWYLAVIVGFCGVSLLFDMLPEFVARETTDHYVLTEAGNVVLQEFFY